ncbi:MAG: MBL fold metallo-hydrolase [Candidatus Nezhaarchaeota archaeon]|nr:MBL fold metallo-hydrolase [Candidatus Nezhaarchaeota archaeon]MCX8141915.1 MBL fold metallo-hydrolase [Candidatus Nezhaarchaeota archaeon]MDW8050304.1 MBL fold metallo-hydrolase [Nitrososphaerota archaeon]
MNSVKVSCLGGCREVGRSAFLIDIGNKRFLLDYGVLLDNHPCFPLHVSPNVIDAILLSHPHLDHSGAIPLLYSTKVKPPLFTTGLNALISKHLIMDMLKLSAPLIPYEDYELQKMLDCVISIDYDSTIKIGEVEIRTLNAGHVPGSCMFTLSTKNFKALYTGDMNPIQTRLVHPVKMNDIVPENPINLLIVESTYGGRSHDNRELTEKSFTSSILKVIEDGGLVLIPAFAYGRAQEILCILYIYFKEFEAYMDGMAKTISLQLAEFKNFLRDSILYESALKKVKFVKGLKDRKRLTSGSGIVISPSGMLKGGPSLFYAQSISRRSDSAIFLVSYQIPGTPGATLLNYGRLNLYSEKVKCDVKWFDFSSHGGRDELIRFITEINDASGNLTKVLLVHGDEDNSTSLMESLKNLGIEVILPRNGDTITLQ